MGVVIVLLMLLSALLLSWACTARPLLEQQPRGAVSLAVMATGGQIRGRVMNTTQEPLLYTPLYLERYSVWSRRWDFVSLAPAPSLEARLSPGEHADEYLAYDERLLEPGHYRVCVGSLPRSAWSLLGALTKQGTLRSRLRPDWPVTCAALRERK